MRFQLIHLRNNMHRSMHIGKICTAVFQYHIVCGNRIALQEYTAKNQMQPALLPGTNTQQHQAENQTNYQHQITEINGDDKRVWILPDIGDQIQNGGIGRICLRLNGIGKQKNGQHISCK